MPVLYHGLSPGYLLSPTLSLSSLLSCSPFATQSRSAAAPILPSVLPPAFPLSLALPPPLPLCAVIYIFVGFLFSSW